MGSNHHAVSGTKRLELNQAFLPRKDSVIAGCHGGYLKKRLQGRIGAPAGALVISILRVQQRSRYYRCSLGLDWLALALVPDTLHMRDDVRRFWVIANCD